MFVTLHSLATMHSNVATEIRLARETGYDGIEFFLPKLERYLEQGHTAAELASHLERYNLQPTCINALLSIERQGEDRTQLLKEAERLCATQAIQGDVPITRRPAPRTRSRWRLHLAGAAPIS